MTGTIGAPLGPPGYRLVHADFAGVAADERDLIFAGNARRLYRFGEPPSPGR